MAICVGLLSFTCEQETLIWHRMKQKYMLTCLIEFVSVIRTDLYSGGGKIVSAGIETAEHKEDFRVE